jgi:hypothetical protein
VEICSVNGGCAYDDDDEDDDDDTVNGWAKL